MISLKRCLGKGEFWKSLTSLMVLFCTCNRVGFISKVNFCISVICKVFAGSLYIPSYTNDNSYKEILRKKLKHIVAICDLAGGVRMCHRLNTHEKNECFKTSFPTNSVLICILFFQLIEPITTISNY